MNRRTILRFALAVLVLSTAMARGDGLIRDGVGAISTGRGGTNLGFADNGAILLDNPAGMVNMSGPGFYEVGLDTVVTDLDYSDPDNDEVNGKFRPYPSPQLAFVRKSADADWAWGIGVFAPAGFGAEYDMQNPHIGPATYKSIGMLAKVLPGVAYRVTDRLSIGGTLGVGFSLAELEGPFYLQTGVLAGVPTQFDLQAKGVTPVGSVGLQYQLTDRTTLGACYVEQSSFDLSGNVNAALGGPGPLSISSRFDANVELAWPRSFGVGVKHNLCACRRVSADVIWYDWSAAFDELDITLTESSNPLFTLLLGPVIRDTFPLAWKDSVSLRLGYEWEPNDRDLWRAGYVYHESPVSDSTLTPYIDGVLEHAFSAGYTRRYDRYLLNLAYQYSFSPERRVGNSDIVGADFDNSTFQAQAHWLSLSVLVPF